MSERQRELKAKKHNEQNLLKKCIQAWKSDINRFKSLNQNVNEMFKQKQNEHLNMLFTEWRLNVKEIKEEKVYEQLAMSFYLKQLMKKILNEWNSFTSTCKMKRFREQEMLETFNLDIKKKLIQRDMFKKWLCKTRCKLSDEFKEKKAQHFYGQHKKCQILNCLKSYCAERREKKLLCQRANLFLQIRLKTEFFFKWSSAFEYEQQIRDKNEKALLLWSINVQKMCFNAWLKFHLIKKEKQNRYKQALCDRQLDIMKECAQRFLVYTMDAKQRRFKSNLLMKEKCLLNEFELESKYFYLWTSKCKINLVKAMKSAPKPIVNKKDSKSNRFADDFSLEKRENITGTSCLKKVEKNQSDFVSDMVIKSRPAPRKPKFLLDSVDSSAPVNQINQEEPIGLLPVNNNADQVFLIPPTVFAQSASNISYTYSPVSHSSFMSPVVDNYVKPPEIIIQSPSLFNQNLETSNCEKNGDKIQKEFELVELKKRLENLSAKTDKLK